MTFRMASYEPCVEHYPQQFQKCSTPWLGGFLIDRVANPLSLSCPPTQWGAPHTATHTPTHTHTHTTTPPSLTHTHTRAHTQTPHIINLCETESFRLKKKGKLVCFNECNVYISVQPEVININIRIYI